MKFTSIMWIFHEKDSEYDVLTLNCEYYHKKKNWKILLCSDLIHTSVLQEIHSSEPSIIKSQLYMHCYNDCIYCVWLLLRAIRGYKNGLWQYKWMKIMWEIISHKNIVHGSTAAAQILITIQLNIWTENNTITLNLKVHDHLNLWWFVIIEECLNIVIVKTFMHKQILSIPKWWSRTHWNCITSICSFISDTYLPTFHFKRYLH